MDKTEFWNSENFWMPALLTYLIAGFIALVFATIIWDKVLWSSKQDDYLSKQFLYRAVSGETVDEKAAYFNNNIMDVRTGEFFRDETKKGVKFEDIVKKIDETANEFAKFTGDGRRVKIEKYKEYLRSKYNMPEAILYLADSDRWKKFNEKESNVNELKQALTGTMPKLKKPDYYEGIRRYILFWVFLVQLLAYWIAFHMFRREEYWQTNYLKQVHIGFGGFITFLIFIPGALPIIIVQLMMIGWYRLNKSYLDHSNKVVEKKSAAKSFDLGADSGQKLLEKLRQRVR